MLFYSTLPTQEEIENLPAFPREKLNLRFLLGSGAFGEVYEGTAVDILGVGSGKIKVAVKVNVHLSALPGRWLHRNPALVAEERPSSSVTRCAACLKAESQSAY